MIKVIKKDNESTQKLLKRFMKHVKSRRLIPKFRGLKYFKQKPTKKVQRESAVIREKYRAENKKKLFL
jgi:ribosomal protein S21